MIWKACPRRSSSRSFVVIYLISSIKILAEYERAVIFRLGKLLPQPKGPGVALVFAPIDRMVKVSLRTVVLDVPPQDVITKDNVSVKVNAVLYYRVIDPRRAIVEVENFHYATSQLAQTTLRSVLGQVELDDLLSERERLNRELAGNSRPAHRSMGNQGVGGRSQARGFAGEHAARDGAASSAREIQERSVTSRAHSRVADSIAPGNALEMSMRSTYWGACRDSYSFFASGVIFS